MVAMHKEGLPYRLIGRNVQLSKKKPKRAENSGELSSTVQRFRRPVPYILPEDLPAQWS
jgi:hypothetical protein